MAVEELNQLAAPVFEALVNGLCSGPSGVGILPERLTFSLTVSPEEEPRFIEVLTKLLRANETFGYEAPVVFLVSRQVNLPFDGDGLDQTSWDLMFDLNPRVMPDDDMIERQLHALFQVLEDEGLLSF